MRSSLGDGSIPRNHNVIVGTPQLTLAAGELLFRQQTLGDQTQVASDHQQIKAYL
jgi:hypothetical protein